MALPEYSSKLLIRLAPRDVAMFRFLLEGHDNLALFTVLDKDECLLELVFAEYSRQAVIKTLAEIAQAISLDVREWPF